MKKNYSIRFLLFVTAGLFIHYTSVFGQAPVTLTFTHTGSMQQFTVPPCVGTMTIEVRGAQGAAGGGGGPVGANGGAVRGIMTATPGSVMYIFVGGQGSVTAGGFNGGGNGGTSSGTQGGGGGGASDVRIGGMALANRIIVAGGGGGAGGSSTYLPNAGAGGGGSAFTSAVGVGGLGAVGSCATGLNGGEFGGSATSYGSGGGGAGFLSGGGAGGLGSSTGGYGCPGVLGAGGDGGGTTFICGGATGGVNGGGGGGGGYFGGGGGMTGTGGCNGGGGGGSSWINSTLMSSPSFSGGNVTGHGQVVITYAFNGSLVSASVSPFAICNGGSANISASGASTYTWSTGSNANSILVSPPTTQNYTVAGTNSIGCVSSAVITVTVNSGLPTLSINSSTNSVCPTNTVVLTASGAINYTWTGGITNGVPFSPLVTTAYTVSGQNGCGTSTALTTITVTPLPVVAITSSSVVCSGNTATLSVGGASTYTWQPGNLNGASIVVSPFANTIYTVIGSSGPCAGISTVAVSTNPNPTITTTSSNFTLCAGESSTLTASGALSYTWTPGGVGSSIVVSPLVPTAYNVVGANSFGCLAFTTQPVIAYAGPNMNNSSGATTYAWSNGATTAITTATPASTTVYTVVGSDPNSPCSTTKTIEINVFTATISVSNPTAICLGESTTLTASIQRPFVWVNQPHSRHQELILTTGATEALAAA